MESEDQDFDENSVCYAMVESNGANGACRCSCSADDVEAAEDSSELSQGCCNPQIFTSILLGILACVLVTGGVFLAFHKWDIMWLLVSGVGIVLIFIGTILHCCSQRSVNKPNMRKHSTAGKGCCNRLPSTDHNPHPHGLGNNGSLTEQLLPLSNARSVSQLSLNMLPGYFPPMVSAYGIEQHSTVVQNINRIIQQQQQQQQQQQNSGSTSPGVISSSGKSYILLSIPNDATPANIQNLVATVYQLDGSVVAENQPCELASRPSNSACTPKATTPPVLKNVEVQTCHIWPKNTQVTSNEESTSIATSPIVPMQIITTEQQQQSNADIQQVSEGIQCDTSTQVEDLSLSTNETNLMDCNEIIISECDNSHISCDNQENLPSVPVTSTEPSSSILVDISETIPDNVNDSAILVDVSESSSSNIPEPSTPIISNSIPSEILVDISETQNVPLNEGTSNENLLDSITDNINNAQPPVITMTEEIQVEIIQDTNVIPNSSHLEATHSEPSSSISNLSAIDAEGDEGEFLEPPPSYEDVTHEGESAVGAFGLAYGTI